MMIGSEPSSPDLTSVHQRCDDVAERGGRCDGGPAGGRCGAHWVTSSASTWPGTFESSPDGDRLDDLLLVGLGALELGHVLAEAQHRDRVGDLEDVVKVVGDDDHAQALLAQAPDQLEHLSRLRHAEGGGGLVEEHHARVPHHGLGHGHRLALPAGQAGHGLAHGADRGDRQLVERLQRARLHPRLVEPFQAVEPLAPEEHVLDHVEVVGQREVLVDHLDPEAGGVLRPRDVHGLAVEQDLSAVDVVDPGDALDQRRLAGAVVADEGHHLAGVHVEVDLMQGQRPHRSAWRPRAAPEPGCRSLHPPLARMRPGAP